MTTRPDPLAEPAPGGTLILGVGNLLMGDEGVGVHVLRALEADPPPGARLLDGGTGGVNLLTEIQAAERVIMIDATRDGQPAGTLIHLRPGSPGELPRGLSAHDFGVKDLFAAAALLGDFPDVHLFTISVEELQPMSMDLSPRVTAAVPLALAAVRALAAKLARTTELVAPSTLNSTAS
jgi:hydrogenase maturation protease